MKFQPWTPGSSGLICLPDPKHTNKNESPPHFVADIDEEGRYEPKTDLMRWADA